MMHRTQILLEDWQYHSLQDLAQKKGTTLSFLIRTWITEKVRGNFSQKRKKFLKFAGIFQDDPQVSIRHDQYLGKRIKK